MHAFTQVGRVLLTLAVALGVLAGPMACTPAESKQRSSRTGRVTKSQIPDPGPDSPGRPTAPLRSATDPCADRLHAICGAMLLYYHLNRRLPADFEELRAIAGPDPEVEFTCPVSGKPYVYNPQGLPPVKGRPGLLVLYDAEGTHSGLRWAVVAVQPRNTAQPLVTEVVAQPDVLFRDAPPSPLAPPDAPGQQ